MLVSGTGTVLAIAVSVVNTVKLFPALTLMGIFGKSNALKTKLLSAVSASNNNRVPGHNPSQITLHRCHRCLRFWA